MAADNCSQLRNLLKVGSEASAHITTTPGMHESLVVGTYISILDRDRLLCMVRCKIHCALSSSQRTESVPVELPEHSVHHSPMWWTFLLFTVTSHDEVAGLRATSSDFHKDFSRDTFAPLSRIPSLPSSCRCDFLTLHPVIPLYDCFYLQVLRGSDALQSDSIRVDGVGREGA